MSSLQKVQVNLESSILLPVIKKHSNSASINTESPYSLK